MDNRFHIDDWVVPTEGPEKRRPGRVVAVRRSSNGTEHLYQLSHDGERLPYEYHTMQLLSGAQAFTVAGIFVEVEVRQSTMYALLEEWFPKVCGLTSLDDVIEQDVPFQPITFSVQETEDPHFRSSVDFDLFPARKGDTESTEIQLALCRRFSAEFGCRTLCAAGRFSDYGEEYPYHSLIWDGEQWFLVDDDGTTLYDGSGGPMRIVRPIELPRLGFDEWGLLYSLEG